MKIQALFSNGKYWQKKAQFKNSKNQNKHNIVLKWQTLAKIGRMWDKQAAAKSGIKFALAFSGKYWHKKSDKMRVRKPYGKKCQKVAKCSTSKLWQSMVQALIIGLNLVKQLNFKNGVNVLSFPLYKTLLCHIYWLQKVV